MADNITNTSTSTSEAAARISALLDQLETLVVDFPQPDAARAATVRANARFAGELVTPTITAVTNYDPLRSHNLFDVFEVATRITVLRLGRDVGVYEREKTTQQEIVQAITAGIPTKVAGIPETAPELAS